MFTAYITDFDPMKGKNQLKKLLQESASYEIPESNTIYHFAENHIKLYNEVLSTKKLKHVPPKDYTITQNFMNGHI
ncbi:MAG: hypothetical protein CM15mV19_0680 [uncultured marine virus]|nr:MAG: hypothetical protein CM15mV19_0680 [uncultured marine virus]